MWSVWKSLRQRWWVIFQVFGLDIKSCAASFPNSCFSWLDRSHIGPPSCCSCGLCEFPAHRWPLPVRHSEVVSVTEGPQTFRSLLKKSRESLALECVGCSLTAATVSSLTSYSWPQALIGRCSASNSRQHCRGDPSCLKAALSGIIRTCRENRLMVPIRLLCPQHSFSTCSSKKA